MPKPLCVIVTGRPGSGKTTLAQELARRLWLPVISRDAIKEGYVNTHGVKHDELPPETNGIVTKLFFDLVSAHLTGQISIVIEAAFQHPIWAQHIERLSELSRPVLVICALEADLAAKRHLARGLATPEREFYHGDKRVAEFRLTGRISPPADYTPPALNYPTLHVSTANGYIPTLDDLVQQIRAIYA